MMDMKLSEAIRNGSKLRPASEHGWVDWDEKGNPRTCALVAACEATGLISHDGTTWHAGKDAHVSRPQHVDARTGVVEEPGAFAVVMPPEWSLISNAREIPPCPCKVHGLSDEVMTIIWHLHDIHRWSREAVAEWIGTVEEKVEKRNAVNQKVPRPLEKQTDDAPALAETR